LRKKGKNIRFIISRSKKFCFRPAVLLLSDAPPLREGRVKNQPFIPLTPALSRPGRGGIQEIFDLLIIILTGSE
jgi:hypothetical protein